MAQSINQSVTYFNHLDTHRFDWSKRAGTELTLELDSSMAAMGLLTLLTNLLTCSKCRVISVARTMSMMACRRVRNWVLHGRTHTLGATQRTDQGRRQLQLGLPDWDRFPTQSGNPSCSALQLGLPDWVGNMARGL